MGTLRMFMTGVATFGLLVRCGSYEEAESTTPATAASTSSAPPPTESTAAPTSAAPVAEGLDDEFDVSDGRQMHIKCTGTSEPGAPTVVFESGLGESGLQWNNTTAALAGAVRACAYDRAGQGGSDPGPKPTTTAAQVADFHVLLGAAGVAPPYLLVAHSIGGFNVRVYADRFPDEVGGVVLVDARPPDASRRWLELLPPESPDESEAIAGNRFDITVFEQTPTMNEEFLDIAASAQEATDVAGFGDAPTVVLVAGIVDDGGLEPELGEQFAAVWRELQAGQAALSTNGSMRVVEHSGHDIPREAPEAIAEAITEVLSMITV